MQNYKAASGPKMQNKKVDKIHGGIINTSRPPPQDLGKKPLEIESENFKWNGKDCITLKNLEASKLRKQKVMGKQQQP